jgi:hypothetical protein
MAKKVYANINLGSFTPIFRFKIVVIFTNWLFQGILYADKTEKIFKLFFDWALTVIIYKLVFGSHNHIHILIAFLISHTFSWIFNGQLFALAKNFGIVHNDPEEIINYAYGIKNRASREKSINIVVVYGSIVRKEIKDTSDLDLRIIRKKGLLNGFRACIFGFKERSRALFYRFPLDMYVVDSSKHLLKMRYDEKPLILYDSSNNSLDT